MLEFTQDYLKSIFNYDPLTGLLTWKQREDRSLAWNTRFAGKIAASKQKRKTTHCTYLQTGLNGKQYRTHRLIWIIMTGKEPLNIDHINGDGTDNRWENLRSVTQKENCNNMLFHRKDVKSKWHKEAKKLLNIM